MSLSAGRRGSNQGGGSRDHGHGRGAGPPNAAPATVSGQSSNWQGIGSPSPSGNSQMIRRSQTATVLPRTRSQQAAALSPMTRSQQAAALLPMMTRSQAAALSPMTRSQAAALSPMTCSQAAALSPMTRSQAATAGRYAGFTNPGSGVGGMSSRSQQVQQQEQ